MEAILTQKKRNRSNNQAAHKKASPFFNKAIVQRKLSIGVANDIYEAEADRIANQVVNMSDNQVQTKLQTGALVQRKCTDCEEEDKIQKQPLAESINPLIQKSAFSNGGESVASESVSTKINSSRGGGSIMSNDTRNFMENSFGADFSNVRIHSGSNAIQLNRELNAQAFTVGNDIYFNEGKYNPNSNSGKHLLAHELTHTVQQGSIKRKIQKSCHDGNCEECEGGTKRLWFTIFFRTRATRTTMRALRERINEAKRILRNCCIDARFAFDWRLLPRGGTFDWGSDPTGSDYSDEAENLGEGSAFSGSRGIPVVVADTVPGTGGGVTVTPLTDSNYTGNAYIAISITHGKIRAIAHEAGHVSGILTHTAIASVMDGRVSTNVTEPYCNSMRAIAT